MKRSNKRRDRRINENFAVYFAMLKAGFKRKPTANPVEHARRCAAEKLSVQRRYCDAFALWQSCGRPECRRQRSCRGDAHACLRRALESGAARRRNCRRNKPSSRQRRAISALPNVRRGNACRMIFMTSRNAQDAAR